MKMFSDCSGRCDDCYFGFTGGCVAGHGDDGFTQITEKDAIMIIKRGWVKYDGDTEELLKRFPNIERKLKIDKIYGKI
jgi:poly-D-alanine transfer protein DltD